MYIEGGGTTYRSYSDCELVRATYAPHWKCGKTAMSFPADITDRPPCAGIEAGPCGMVSGKLELYENIPLRQTQKKRHCTERRGASVIMTEAYYNGKVSGKAMGNKVRYPREEKRERPHCGIYKRKLSCEEVYLSRNSAASEGIPFQAASTKG